MKKILSMLILGVMGIGFPKLYAPSLTISQPGYYQLTQSLSASPAAAGDAIILISSSNVILDLHGNAIIQSNATSSIDGIRISPNLHDVTIQNGAVRNVTGNGLAILPTSTKVEIMNVMFENCGATGINADGFAGAINNLDISECQFIGCGSNSTSTTILNLVNCIDSSINECQIAGSSNTAAASFAVCSILSSSLISVNDLHIEDNVSTASFFAGFSDSFNTACSFNQIVVQKNLDITSTFAGFLVSSIANVYSNCLCASNSNGVNGAFYGFAITSSINAQNNVFQNCGVLSNLSVAQQGLFGFYIDAPNNSFFNCFALSNTNFNRDVGTAPTGGLTNIFGSTVGFYITGPVANFILLDNCVAANNIGNNVAGSITAGLILQRLNGINTVNNSILKSIFFNNFAAAGVSSRAIVNQTGTLTLFTRNIGYQGSTGSTQSPFSGISAGSITTPTAPATDNINDATVYWTNVNVIA